MDPELGFSKSCNRSGRKQSMNKVMGKRKAAFLVPFSAMKIEAFDTALKEVVESAARRWCADRGWQSDCTTLKEAVEMLEQGGIHADAAGYASLLRWCGKEKALPEVKRVHDCVLRGGYEQDSLVANLLLQAYGKCGKADLSRVVFDRISLKNMFSWTIMIAAYAQNGHCREALLLFREMNLEGMKASSVTYVTLLGAFSNPRFLAEGKAIHARIVATGWESDIIVATAVMNMYGKCSSLEDARSVFDRLPPHRNLITWTTLITAYAQQGHGRDAIELYRRMEREGIKPDAVTFVSVVDACSTLGALEEGKEVHRSIIASGCESNVTVANAVVNMYGKCGMLDDARAVFDRMPARNSSSWNSILTAYAQQGHGREALDLFKEMDTRAVKPNVITFTSVIAACSDLGALADGKAIHKQIVASGYGSDDVLCNSLINMYGKCGKLDEATAIFSRMPRKSVVSWTAIIAGYAQQGHVRDTLELFRQMQLEGITPDDVAFVSVLFACSHAGLLKDSCQNFVSMVGDYGIKPITEHYCCMVDLLSRSGKLDEAEDLINCTVKSSAVLWMTLLGACKTHKDVVRAERIAERACELDPDYSSTYVMLSNIYAEAGEWDKSIEIRKRMDERKVKKQPGYSSIEINNKVHEFVVGDKSHPLNRDIRAEMQRLNKLMKAAGYAPDLKVVLHNRTDEEKEEMLSYHSERLAIAFGLISTPPGTPLCIVKNLRVCSDCHTATKFISKIARREITVRDTNRFHRFEHGECSCGDYW